MEYNARNVEIIFDEFFQVERARVRWEQFEGSMGEEHTRYAIRRGESVGVVPVCEKSEEVVLVNQFRYPAAGKASDGYLWEIPAGMVDEGESLEKTAERELLEEIGTCGKKLTPLISFFLSPGALDEKFHLFWTKVPDCLQISPIGGNKTESENLQVRSFEKETLLRMIRQNMIQDAKTIASLLFYYSFISHTSGGSRE
jgi:ADP-ribose pyrophosphatase